MSGYKPSVRDKTKEEMAAELAILRERVAQLERAERDRELLEERLREINKNLIIAGVREQLARSEAEAASQVKDEFLATVSHELRTPLTAILGWSQLLTSGKLDEAGKFQAGETIARNAKAQSQLINDLLDISRIITGKMRLTTCELALKPIIEAVRETVRPAADAKSIQLILNLDENVGTVMGDADRLQQICWNLLTNAIKFTPKGGCVQVSLVQKGGQARLSVSDNGHGINEEFLPHIFNRFRQADTTKELGGLGLGLAIVRELVVLHGGTIKAESAGKGQGATFIIDIPLISRYKMTAQLEQPPTQADSENEAALPDGLWVLVVEDKEDNRELLSTILAQGGAKVTAVSSVREALLVFDKFRPDLVISDIGMPEEDGYSLINKIRSRTPAEGGETMALALTAYAREEDRLRALTAGFQMHMAKPIDPAELLRVVASLAERNRKP